MNDTRQIAIDLIQQKGYPYWKLYEGNRRVAQCESDENPEGTPEVALQLFVEELAGRSGKHDISVYKKEKGETGGSRKTFFLIDTPTRNTMAFGQNNMMDIQAIYEQARKDVEAMERMKRIEEKLDLVLLYIKNANDDDDKNDGMAVNLISKVLGNAISKPGATAAIPTPRPAANAGVFS
jgi:hypothetical protein